MPITFSQRSVTLTEPSFKSPVCLNDAERRADKLLAKLTTAEKLELISGHRTFYIKGFPQHGIPELYLSDGSGGLHIRRNIHNVPERSTAFPCPLALAATWNLRLAYRYARAIGEECRAGGIAILLGPGMNIYRHAQCGRNFEYFGEDPFLAAQLVERYVTGVLDTGTLPTLKHFVANETEFHRRTSNSVVDDRAMREIYLPAFKAGIDAGAPVVMTSYNLLNGEWCGQSHAVITELLRDRLGFKGIVMSDWYSVWDAEKMIKSGLDLEMPGDKFIQGDGERLLHEGRVTVAQIDRMAKSIICTCISMGLYDRPAQDCYYATRFLEHERVALETARESVVLLKNDGILPIDPLAVGEILVTGLFVETLARGLGSSEVVGYNQVSLLQALSERFGGRVRYIKNPSDEEIRSAGVVLLSTGTIDSEGRDRPFELPATEAQRVCRSVSLNPRTVVLVNSGGGIGMAAWNDQAAAILHGWYPGQNGNRALAEILAGDVNPSGKLPITIERCFEDSPGSGYLPRGEALYGGWGEDNNMARPVHNIEYKEGIFVGYRWYEARKIMPLYAFGHGLSYTTFEYSNLCLSTDTLVEGGRVSLEFSVTNTGRASGSETTQLYIRDTQSSVARPPQELKAFKKVSLQPGETKVVRFWLDARAFAFWDIDSGVWKAEEHEYILRIGSASDAIRLEGRITLKST